jgi:hypothetical protein
MQPVIRAAAAAVGVACAAPTPAITAVTPSEGWALGGDTIRIEGADLTDVSAVWFGATPATSFGVSDDGAVLAEAPRGLAGLVDLRVAVGEDEAVAGDAYRYLPLGLAFVDAGAGWLPDAGPLVDGRVVDLDGDGHDDALVLGADGALRWWRGTGQGSLLDGGVLTPDRVGGFAVIDLDGDGRLDVATCGAGPEGPRALLGVAEGPPLHRPGLLPPLPGGCDALSAASDPPTLGVLRREGGGSVVEWLVAEGAGDARTWRRPGPPSAGACPIFGEATCAVDGEGDPTATLTATGPAALRVGLDLRQVPTALELDVLAGDLPLEGYLVDAGGEVFGAPLTLANGTAAASDPAAWAGDADGAIDLPIREAGVRIAGAPDAAPLVVDDLRLRLEQGGRATLADFAAWPGTFRLERRHHHLLVEDLDQDGALDALVGDAASGGDARLYVGAIGAFAPESRLVVPPCGIGGLAAWTSPTGAPDLAMTCRGGQDRLFLGDGAGRWFDDTERALPVDAADGAGITAADLDLDGIPELLVANRDGVDRVYGSYDDRWVDRSARLGLDVLDTRRVLVLDIDADGDLDLLRLGAFGARLDVGAPTGPRED